MRILTQVCLPKAIFINLFFLGGLNLFTIIDPVSQADDSLNLSDKLDKVLYCQNEGINPPHAAPIKDSLGIEIRSVITADVEKYGLDSLYGIVIVSLLSASPMTRIGFEEKDVVLEINGEKIKDRNDFLAVLNKLKRQQRVTFRALDHRTGKIGYVQFTIP